MRWAVACVVVYLGCLASCDGDPPKTAAPLDDGCVHVEGLDALPSADAYSYSWSCSGEVPPTLLPLPNETVPDDCTTGVWPDLDDTRDVCPTASSTTRVDPVSGKTLPSEDGRSLPTEVGVTESGSFLPSDAPSAWPSRLRVVAWNMEYTAHLDDQIATLLSHPELSKGDVFLLSEVDRCSSRNQFRRGARRIAEALRASYVYGVEFVELNIDRDVGGDTGQAIVSRRPLSGAALTCHSSQYDWFASPSEPRLGQRVALHADVPLGDASVRLYAVHLESSDLFGDLRSIQSKEILDDAQQRACERPHVVAGDFNAPYCAAPEVQLFRDAGFLDAVGIAGDVEATHSGGFRLDYVLSRGLRVVAGGVARGLGASDHDALWVDLER